MAAPRKIASVVQQEPTQAYEAAMMNVVAHLASGSEARQLVSGAAPSSLAKALATDAVQVLDRAMVTSSDNTQAEWARLFRKQLNY